MDVICLTHHRGRVCSNLCSTDLRCGCPQWFGRWQFITRIRLLKYFWRRPWQGARNILLYFWQKQKFLRRIRLLCCILIHDQSLIQVVGIMILQQVLWFCVVDHGHGFFDPTLLISNLFGFCPVLRQQGFIPSSLIAITKNLSCNPFYFRYKLLVAGERRFDVAQWQSSSYFFYFPFSPFLCVIVEVSFVDEKMLTRWRWFHYFFQTVTNYCKHSTVLCPSFIFAFQNSNDLKEFPVDRISKSTFKLEEDYIIYHRKSWLRFLGHKHVLENRILTTTSHVISCCLMKSAAVFRSSFVSSKSGEWNRQMISFRITLYWRTTVNGQ